MSQISKNNFDRILKFRERFSHPMSVSVDGHSINDHYYEYQTKSLEDRLLWTDIETIQLINGLYKHGVHDMHVWIKIKDEFIPHRDWITIQFKLQSLLGRQNLGIYEGMKFENELQIAAEFENNKKKAMENGRWNEELQMYVEFSDEERKESGDGLLDKWFFNLKNCKYQMLQGEEKFQEVCEGEYGGKGKISV